MNDNEARGQVVSEFLSSCGRDYAFPAGGKIEILTAEETRLLDVLQQSMISDVDKIGFLSGGSDWNDHYSIVIFGIRLAILGTRTGSPETYTSGILALVSGGPKIDWRDRLRALAVFEECGRRLGVDFKSEIKNVMENVGGDFQGRVDKYFSRSADRRTVNALGLEACGEGAELTFRSNM